MSSDSRLYTVYVQTAAAQYWIHQRRDGKYILVLQYENATRFVFKFQAERAEKHIQDTAKRLDVHIVSQVQFA